ncbi:UDP-N-acetylhexosamine pyrophosphorylase [Acropora cervicornis]|uniref:UDP-N-acetylglucosamine diphosphorylase n=1 Tax=Acropora cervicornis TaxID=6130 RepID=A0AAD9PZ67_ACRCE|nr:UDP-N-acetylhexosamine pyrophosphorylase [Acropora cervicornis]
MEKLQIHLKENHQEHLLKHLAALSEEQQKAFHHDLLKIDFPKINRSFKKTMTEANASDKKDEKLQPVPPENVGSVIGEENSSTVLEWRERGLQVVSEGKVAVLLLAGGQGTRLGVSYPKGMYDVGLPSGKTLYQLQAERILKVQDLAFIQTGKKYIMTSEHTIDDTKKFFEDHKYFGLQMNDVIFFEQHTLPCFFFDGKIILDQLGKVARAPGGNGGLYEALRDDSRIDEMKNRGIEYVHVYCVDNILVKMADPVFIGFCIDKSVECGAKVVEKTKPEEKVGLVVRCNGKFQVAEYSEISEEVQQRRDPDGKLTFREGNLANHFFTIGFLEKVVKELEPSLQFHIAKKKIPYINNAGERIIPKETNGIKLEKFVFDVFEFTQQFAVLEVAREEEFSPLKNAPGSTSDNSDTAKRDLFNLHYNYIIKAGGNFVDSDESTPVVCEISPLLSYAGEGLEDEVRGKQFSARHNLYLMGKNEETTEENGEIPSKKIKES